VIPAQPRPAVPGPDRATPPAFMNTRSTLNPPGESLIGGAIITGLRR
jgi:hypothetical protein